MPKSTPEKRDERSRDVRRRFEQWAHNPKCAANTLAAVHNIRMAEVAKADGIQPSMGQSPFALARGQTFEKSLFRNEAASLLAELLRAEVLPKKARGFLDLRLSLNGGRLPNLDVARARTKELLVAVAQFGQGKGPRLPALVAGATVCIPGGVMLPEAILVIDALVIRSES